MATFNSTPGAADATSLISREVADGLLAATPSAESWAEQPEQEREQALIEASSTISAARYVGRRSVAGQALAFPRDGLPATEIDPEPDGIIPRAVAQATALLAFLFITNSPQIASLRLGGSASASGFGGLAGLKSLEIGPIKLALADPAAVAEAAAARADDRPRLPSIVRWLLAPYLPPEPLPAGGIIFGQIPAERTS